MAKKSIDWANSEDKRNLIKVLLEQGLTYREIGRKMNLSYDQIEGVVKRYNLKLQINNPVFKKDKNKLTNDDVTTLASVLGQKLYEEYREVKLKEPKAKTKSPSKREETSILDISDVHVGMINEALDPNSGEKIITYNMNIFQKELNQLYIAIHKLHTILSHSYKLRKLVIFFLGDLITNDRIFPEQTFEIEKVVGLQIWDVINYFIYLFNQLLTIYEKIEIVAVVGNHGRSNPHHYNEPVENNFEYFIYKTWQKQFDGSKRIKVIVPTVRRYTHKIYNWKHLIEHGDAMRGSSETAIEKQIKDLSINMGGFDVMHMGHYHTIKEREIADKVIVKQNGGWIEKDNYAFHKYKTYSSPRQWFMGCSEKRPETFSYKIDLRG